MKPKKPRSVRAYDVLIGSAPVWRLQPVGCIHCGGVEHTRSCWFRRVVAILEPEARDFYRKARKAKKR